MSEYFDIDKRAKMDVPYINDMISFADIPKKACVLDVGCGSGIVAKCIKDKRQDVVLYGLDLNSDYIIANQEKYSDTNIKFLTGDVFSMDFSDGYFDVIFSRYMFETMSMENRKKALKEMVRVLKNDGSIVIYTNITEILVPARPGKSMMKVWNSMKHINDLLGSRNGKMIEFIDYLYRHYTVKVLPVYKDSISPGNQFLIDYYKYTENEKRNLKSNILVRIGLLSEEDLLRYNRDLLEWLSNDGYTYQLQGVLKISK